MVRRSAMLAQPCESEFFKKVFGGRTPTLEEKLFWIEGAILRMTSLEIYENDLYSVEVANDHPFIHLSITRLDRQPCKEWKHLQAIKNELVGAEYEAVELYPAESRLVDAGHEYHLWVHSDPAYRFGLGFNVRFVLSEPISAARLDSEALRPDARAGQVACLAT